jgi:hypothetical protein
MNGNMPAATYLTVRQWYTGQALIGLLMMTTDVNIGAYLLAGVPQDEFPKGIARAALQIADAMLAQEDEA